MKVQDVEIKKIDIHENVRLSHGDPEIKQLMESIKQHGLKEPIGATSEKNGRYILLYGFRRLLAYKKLGYETIPTVLDDPMEMKDHLIINTIENLQRRDVTPHELGRICESLLKMNLTLGEIAVRLSVSTAKVKSALEIYRNLPESVRKNVAYVGPGQKNKAGKIAAQTAYDVVQMARDAQLSKNEVAALINEIRKEDLSGAEVANVAKLMGEGLSVRKAISQNRQYMVIRVNVTLKKKELMDRRKKAGATAPDLIKMICYGYEEPLTKPSFVSFANKKVKKDQE